MLTIFRNYLLLLILIGVSAAQAETPLRKEPRPVAAKASTAKPFKIQTQALGSLKKVVFLPNVTPGAKKVLEFRDAHRADSVIAQSSSRAGQLEEANTNQRQIAHIISVNDKSFSSTWIVPGAAYVIKGWGFGTTPGEVKLIGGFPNGAPKFRIDLWQDNVIHAYLEDNISGAYDQQNATLAISAPGILWTHDKVNFFAAREVREFNVGPYYQPAPMEDGRKYYFKGVRATSTHNGLFRVEGTVEWKVEQRNFRTTDTYPYYTCDEAMGEKEFKHGNADQFNFSAFKPGWSAVGYEWYHGRVDQGSTDYLGKPGAMVTDAAYDDGHTYSVVLNPNQLIVKWAVFNSVTKRPCAEDNPAFAWTLYEIKGFAEGPKGTAIF
jgi:hypothetical protein